MGYEVNRKGRRYGSINDDDENDSQSTHYWTNRLRFHLEKGSLLQRHSQED